MQAFLSGRDRIPAAGVVADPQATVDGITSRDTERVMGYICPVADARGASIRQR